MENEHKDYIDSISKLDYQREFTNIKSDLITVKRRLKAKKKALLALKEEAEIIQYLELLNHPKVAKYLKMNEDISKLEYAEFGLERKYELLSQLMCNHPALLVTEEVTYDSGIYSTCKCLECKKIVNTKEQAVNPDALIYIKPRTSFYFITEEEIKKIETEYDNQRGNKKNSPRKLVRKLNNQGNS